MEKRRFFWANTNYFETWRLIIEGSDQSEIHEFDGFLLTDCGRPFAFMNLVFVHGWSVTTTATYGGLADTLEKSAQTSGLQIDVRNIYLSRYVSFKDEVRLEDISRAFEAAVQRELMKDLGQDKRFICITHSTGGPVIRDWLTRFYVNPEKPLWHSVYSETHRISVGYNLILDKK